MADKVDISSLQNPETGVFAGDEWGETDTRFLYGALNALSLMGMLDVVNIPKAIAYVQSCQNFDGAYGVSPGAESHSGQVFTCVGALSIVNRLDLVDQDRLGGWLSERQLPHGGLNGRPEKLEDVCYSWWVLSSLAMIDRLHWVNRDKLIHFILRCQVCSEIDQGFRIDVACRTFKWEVSLIGQVIWLMYSTRISVLLASVFSDTLASERSTLDSKPGVSSPGIFS